MNLLLDTQIFLWMTLQRDRLSDLVSSALQNPDNRLTLSVVSMWEMQLKNQIGKLPLPQPVRQFVVSQRRVNDVGALPVFEHHVWTLNRMPLHHRDPFDRLLIAQAIAEDFTLVSADPLFAKYDVPLLSAE